MEKMLRDLGDKVSTSDRQRIEQVIEELKQAKQGDDAARIRQLIEQLQQASYAIGQQMYAEQQAASGPQAEPSPGADGGEEDKGKGSDEIFEGEFREV